MESLSPQVVCAAKLPILNPNEFDLWKMRIKQYILMNDYSFWEVILNGDSPILTRVIEGVVQLVAPTTAEQRLARKNELKACGTLLMALPDNHRLKFNIHKDAKTLMKAIEKWFGGNKETKKVQKTLFKQQYKNFTGSSFESLYQIYDRMQKLISQLEILGESLSQEDINLNVSAASAKVPVSALPNVDTLSNAVIYSFFASQSNSPQLDNDDLKQIDADDLEEINLKWQMAMLTMRAIRKGHFARECRSPKDTRRNVSVKTQRRNIPVDTSTSNALVSQCDGVGSYDWSFQVEEEPTNYALMAFTSSSSSSSDNEVDSCFKACTKAYATLQLGYDTQVFTSSMFDCDEMFHSETDESLPASPIYDRYQSGEGYHVVPPPYTGTFMPPKPDLVFHDAPTGEPKHTQIAPSFVQKPARPSVKPCEHPILVGHLRKDFPKSKVYSNSRNRKACFMCKSLTHLIKDCDYYEKQMVQKPVRNYAQRGNHQYYAKMTHPNPQRHVVPTTVLTRSKLVPLTAARPVTADVPHSNVIRPRPAKTIGYKPPSPPRRTINHKPSPPASNFPPKVTTVKAPKHALKDKGVIDSGYSRHMTGNMSYLADFEDINGRYVAFGGNPKGRKITCKSKIRTGKLDFDDVYFVKELKFNLFSVSQMYDKKKIVLFTNNECIVLSPEFKLLDENHMLLRVPRENNMYNVDLKNIVPLEI
nr:ribonuclease H-like domain-containing protein [Tanacetum cinerariifolium]